MNRRGFLQLLGMAAAGLAADPERLLWTPGAKTFFLPSAPSIRCNVLVSPEWIQREVLRMLTAELEWTRRIHRCYDEAYRGHLAVGDTVRTVRVSGVWAPR